MKKASLILALLFICFLITSCDFSGLSANKVDILDKSQIVQNLSVLSNSNEKKYEIEDSFKMVDGNYYYLYFVGVVEAAPISITESNGMYYNGTDTTITFSMKQASTDQITKTIKNITSSSISTTSKVQIKAEKQGYIKASAAIERDCTHSISESLESSVARLSSQTKEFSQSVTYKFSSETQDNGYYCYAALASLKLYKIVVYNPNTSSIVSIGDYSIAGQCFPGLIYSKTSFFDLESERINFDVSNIREFPEPMDTLDSEVSITINPMGGTCDLSNITKTIGDVYGDLPSPQWHGHKFVGWYFNGDKIQSDSIVCNDGELQAKWDTVVTNTYTYSGTFSSQNGFGTGKELETATLTIDLSGTFDVPYLKEQYYLCRITLTYNVGYNTTSIGTLKYTLWINNGSQDVFSHEDQISSAKSRNLSTNDFSNYNNILYLKLHTANIQGVAITNLKIKVDFIKN